MSLFFIKFSKISFLKLSSAKRLKHKLFRRSRTGSRPAGFQIPQIILTDTNGDKMDLSSVIGECTNENKHEVFSTLSSGIDSGMTSSFYTDKLVVNSSPISKN